MENSFIIKKFIRFVLVFLFFAALVQESSADVILGDEQFDVYVPLLEGKRVALFSNHTGIVGDKISSKNPEGKHILDALIERNVNVTAIFSPEHGFRGTEDAGAKINNSIDQKTGVPILSLYSKTNKNNSPASEDMKKFDTLVVDIQDVGLRYYTYYISMYHLMNACAVHKKEVIILDRPNPNGFYVDGAILKNSYKSGVGQLPIPVVHGMTLGELAQMINGEGWLKAGKNACNLTVIPCKNYSHDTKFSLLKNPSPNLKNMRAIYLYASTCFFENTLVSVGRGTEFPFEVYGSPYLEGVKNFDFSFTPRSIKGASEPPFKNQVCYGVDLRNIPIEDIWNAGINLDYLISSYNAVMKTSHGKSFWGNPDKKGIYWIDKLSGSNSLRNMIESGKTAQEIKASWQKDIEFFKRQREAYLIYDGKIK